MPERSRRVERLSHLVDGNNRKCLPDGRRGSILLSSRAAALSRLDAGSGGVKPTLSCVIQNLQTSCSSWYMMYET